MQIKDKTIHFRQTHQTEVLKAASEPDATLGPVS